MITYGPEGTRCPGCAEREIELVRALIRVHGALVRLSAGDSVRNLDEVMEHGKNVLDKYLRAWDDRS